MHDVLNSYLHDMVRVCRSHNLLPLLLIAISVTLLVVTLPDDTLASYYKAPTKPTNLTIIPANESVELSWNAPTYSGSSDIIDYKIFYKEASMNIAQWIRVNDGVNTNTTVKIDGLNNGTYYYFAVSAMNEVRTSVSARTSGTPGIPGAPTELLTISRDSHVRVSWKPHDVTGGSALSDFIIQYKKNTDSEFITFEDGKSTNDWAVVTGLTNGITYDFRIAARNQANQGTWSVTVAATPGTVPSVPTELTAISGDGSVKLSWTTPVDIGGSSITEYTVTRRYHESGITSAWYIVWNGKNTTATVSDLVNGRHYEFSVAALNSYGMGPSTSASAIAGAPGIPTDLKAIAGFEQVTLSWTVPTNNGGSAITDYVVQYRVGTNEFQTFADKKNTSTTVTITDLDPGLEYSFRVAAVNDLATGFWSYTASATPKSSVPGYVTGVWADTSITLQTTLHWKAPTYTGISDITDYTIQYKQEDAKVWTSLNDDISTNTTATVTGLTENVTYEYRIAAVNSAGAGPWFVILVL